MKQTITLQTRVLPDRRPWLQSRLHWLGVLSLCAAVIALSACDSGGTSGDGIDPGIIEVPLAFIKRPIAVDDAGDEIQADLREPRLFMAGGDVYLRSNSTVSGDVRNLTRSVTGGQGDVKGLNASFDGSKLIFSLRLFDPDVNDDIVPSWNIYQYDLTSSQLTRIIPFDVIAEEGDDLYPSYLPDGRILFTSNRQRQSREMLINELKARYSSLDEDENIPALVLHVMNADGTDIRQISFNQSHDLYPQVLTNFRDGRIVFSRWDNAAGNNEVNLYTANPDGSDMEILYGSQSHATGTGGANIQFTNIREMENGDLMVITKPFDGTFDGGDIVIIDVDRFADNSKPVWSMNGLRGPAQTSATITNVANDGVTISRGGRYSSAFPLWDGSSRVLVSKSTCQLDVNGETRPCIDKYLKDPNAVEKSPSYGIWLYNMDVDTEKPIILAQPGLVITEVITVQNRTRATVIFDRKLAGRLDPDWENDVVGVVNIKSVYDMGDNQPFNGCYFTVCSPVLGIDEVQDFADPANAVATERPARFVRFIKPVGIPDPNDLTLTDPPDLANNAFGPQRNRGMREIVGYAPVEPDGSVKVKVPANIPLAVEVLDGEGRRIGPQHNNWFQVQPGDTLGCVGCHDLNNGLTPPEIHVRSDAEAPSINSGVPASQQLVNTLIPGTTSPNPYLGAYGQTLAEVRFASVGLTNPPTIEPQLSADLIYEDYWTDPDDVALRMPDTGYAYQYADLPPPLLPPTNTFCSPNWLYNCRITINYLRDIQTIWELDRGAADDFTPLAFVDPVDPGDPTNTPLLTMNAPDGIFDDTCTSCHTTVVTAATSVPYGQLDLTPDQNPVANMFIRPYRELLTDNPAQEIVGGTLQNINPEVQVPSMTVNGARSSFFIEKMTGTQLDSGNPPPAGYDHTNMLTGAELKLISEWLDLGAQNFNDPFDLAAPQN